MLANPPYGKSWKKDLEAMGGKDAMRDPRFKVMHDGEELSLVTRSSDGQMLFLANMASKMNGRRRSAAASPRCTTAARSSPAMPARARATSAAGSSRTTGCEAIVALPLNLFYNTGIATYVWVLSNRKPSHRKGQVQLIDASQWFKPLRKNLGKKNCELSPEDIERINRTFLDFVETPESKIFPNAAFGYWKVTVERPLRLHSQLSSKAIEVAALRVGRRGHPRRAVRGIRRRAVHRLREDRGPAGAAPRRLGQRRRRGRRRGQGPAAGRACPRRSAGSCWTPRPGRATAVSSRSPRSCARRWATRSSRTTTSSAIGWMPRSTRQASSCPPPISSRS
jgi:hypothetical protein